MARLSFAQLEALVAVAEHTSVTTAADVLGISQPSLSRRLQGLEDALGIALLRPVGRGIQLTSAGAEAAATARRALAEASVIEALSESVRTLAAGCLRLTGLPSLVSSFASEVIAPFHLAHPGVNVSMTTEEDASAVVEALRAGRADLALSVPEGAPSDLVAIELPAQRFTVVAHRDLAAHTLPELLKTATLVTLPTDTSMRTMAEQVYRRHHASPAQVLQTTQRDSLVRLALDVHGITIVPEAFEKLAVALGGRCLSLEEQPTRRVGILHTADAVKNPALSLVLEFLPA